MKTTSHSFPASLRCGASLCLALNATAVRADTLFSEGFDTEDSARVSVLRRSSTEMMFVDYSDFERAAPSAGGSTLRVHIPEAPNRISNSAATKGVVLSALYDGPERSIFLLAADAAGGSPIQFSGNYRVRFDMWLSMDPANTDKAGTTEGGAWTVNAPGLVAPARYYRSSSTGNWGWLDTDGDLAPASGDASFFTNGLPIKLLENGIDSPLFSSAFPQAAPFPNTAANQWTAVEISVLGTHIRVKFNGVTFFDQETTLTEGFAGLGYDDIVSSNTPGNGASSSPNWQFGVFDNFVVDEIAGIPSLEVSPSLGFTPVTSAGESSVAEFTATNASGAAVTITGAMIDGVNAAQFQLNATFPLMVPAANAVTIPVNFDAPPPNGLKVARLVLNTNDPDAPTIFLPLQARRSITTIEGSVATAVGSVSVQGGTSTGAISVLNSSSGPVTINSAVFSGSNPTEFSLTTVLPVTIQSGGDALLDVKFTPASEGVIGLHSASADLATTDPSVPTLSIPIKARYAYGPPLLAQYRMDETSGTVLVDDSGTSPNALLQIREAPFGFGKPSLLPTGDGTAIHLLPADDSTKGNFAFVKVAHLPTVSYSLWFKPEAKGTPRTLLHRSSNFSLVGTQYSLYLTSGGQLVFEVNSAPAVQTEDGAIVDGETYHVAITHSDGDGFADGNTAATRTRLYVNGSLISEVAAPDAQGFTDYQLNATAEGLYIGSATAAGEGFSGDMDDLQIYSVELTPDQVAGMYHQPGKTAFDLTQVIVPFDITNVAYDASGGTITLTWSSELNATYLVQQSGTLSGWTTVPGLEGVAGAGGTTTAVINGVSPGGKNYFRIGRSSP